MSIQRFFQSLATTIQEEISVLNIYKSNSSDPIIIRREISSTRLFIVLLSVSVVILSAYTLINFQYKSENVYVTEQLTYEKLQQNYPDTLQCPCKKLLINYKEFVNITPSFHQVCSSHFVSELWIEYVFITNSTSTWPIDIRTSLSSMWRLIRTFCQISTNTTIDTIDQFINSSLISSILLSEKLLKATLDANFKRTLQFASSTLKRPLTTLHRFTQSNELATASAVNYIAVTSNFGKGLLEYYINGYDVIVGMIANKYIFNKSTKYCSCRYNGTCPMPANLYLYSTWEMYGVYNLDELKPNATLLGIVIDCLPIQIVFGSSLECFYDQSCVNLLRFAYQKSIDVTILDKSKSSRFPPKTIIKQLIDELFIENIQIEIIYKKYFLQCIPTYCTYSYIHQFDVFYTITTLLALFGGLSKSLRLISPFIIKFFFLIKNHRSRRNEEQQPTEDRLIYIRIKHIFLKIKKSIIELNLFNKYSQDELRILRGRIATWLFIIFFIISLCILIIYTFFDSRTITKKVQSPTLKQYEDLLKKYRRTLQCPCTTISIPYEDFIQISPIFHQVCTSDFVQSWWYDSLSIKDTHEFEFDLIRTISSYFRTLAAFCEIANLTSIEAIEEFSKTLFVNAQILPLDSFDSQINGFINTFQNMTKADFLYTMLLINKLLEGNQYVSNTMISTNIYKEYIPHLISSDLGSIRFIASSMPAFDCLCIFDSKCDISTFMYVDGIPVRMYSEHFNINPGCFVVDSVLVSSLTCWYLPDCIDKLRVALEKRGLTSFPKVSPLNPERSTRFPLNISTQIIFNEMMIETWNSSSSYRKFYEKCNPIYCTYSYEEKSDIAFVATIIIGFLGGLNIILRLISQFIVKIFFKFIRRKQSTRSIKTRTNEVEVQQDQPMDIPRSRLWTRIHRKLTEFNIFDTESNNIHIIQREKISTRLYLFVLIACIIPITINTILSKQIKTDSISFPSENDYKMNLSNSDFYALQCPCTRVSIQYKDFIEINATFHQVCSSEFIQKHWYYYLHYMDSSYEYETADIRRRGAVYFVFLKSLCQLSQTSVSSMIEQFLTDTFIIAQIIPESEFLVQIDDIIDRFKTTTPQKFIDILTSMNDIVQSSGFISSYFLNWNFWMAYNSTVATLPTRAVVFNKNCSCGIRNECYQSGGVYESSTNIQYFEIPGWKVGCSTVDTLLHSTLECFYNQICIDSLMYYMNTAENESGTISNISSLDINITSRFKPNTVIHDIVGKLFVEDWKIDKSYSAFYNQCAPIQCTLTIKQNNDSSFIFAKVLALYGGLTIILRFIIPHLVQIVFKIRARFRRNIINPIA